MNRITPVTDKADTINDRVRIARAAIQAYGNMGFDLNWIIYGTTDDNALSDLINHLDNNKKLLLSIFADLKDLPAEDLMYLQEAIEIYVKHHQKKKRKKRNE